MNKMCATFKEPVKNNKASRFITDNYDMLVKMIRGMGVNSKCEDLLHDAYIVILKKERDGLGYSEDYGDGITVGKYVIGTLKKYSKNKKYSDTYVDKKVGKNGDSYMVIAASYDEEDEYDTLSKFQEAYKNADCLEDYEDIEAMESMREQIEYCLSFSSEDVFSMRTLFEKMDIIVSLKLDKDIFVDLKRVLDYNDELKETFMSMLRFRERNRAAFDMMLQQI